MTNAASEDKSDVIVTNPRELNERRLKSERLFTGRVLALEFDSVALPNGDVATRELIRHVGAVAVVPLFPDGTVAVEEQYRYPIDRIILEIPAGKLDSPDEDRLAAARRELREETGLIAGSMVCLGDYVGSPAILDEKITLYLATDLSEGNVNRDSDEFLTVRRIPLDVLGEWILAGKIPDGKTQAAISRVILMKEKGLL